MAIATLYADGVAATTEVSSTLSDYTADDGTYGAATEGGNTTLRLDYPTPVANPVTGAGAQTVEWDTRKAGGTNSPAFDVKLYAAGSLVATIATGVSVGVGSATFTFSGFAADGSDLSIEIDQTSGGTGNPSKKAFVETDYLRWVVETESPSVTVVIGAASVSLTAKPVTSVIDAIVSVAASSLALTGRAVIGVVATVEIPGVAAMALTARAVTTLVISVANPTTAAFALTGRAVVATVAAVEVVGKALMALTGRAVQSRIAMLAQPGTASFGLTGKSVSSGGSTTEVIPVASMVLSTLLARLNVTAAIGVADIAVTGRAVQVRSDLIASILAASTVTAGGTVQTTVGVIFDATVATMQLSGQDLTTRLNVLESIATAAINFFGGSVTTLPVDAISGSNLSRLLSLPGVYTFLWKDLVREETTERL